MIHRVPRHRFSWLLSLALACVFLCGNSAPSLGHGTEHALIEAATAAIEEEPHRPELWLHRGELHRKHQEFEKALADYKEAETLGADARLLTLCRTELALDDLRPETGLALLKQSRLKHDVDAARLMARAYFALEDPKAAIEHLAHAIELDPNSRPSHYLELALAHKKRGDLPSGLAVLNQAIADVGSVSSLELEAVSFEVALDQFDAALSRLDRLESQYQRKESILVRRATILSAAGRELEAEAAYTEALLCIEALSPKLRKTDLVQELELEIHRALTK